MQWWLRRSVFVLLLHESSSRQSSSSKSPKSKAPRSSSKKSKGSSMKSNHSDGVIVITNSCQYPLAVYHKDKDGKVQAILGRDNTNPLQTGDAISQSWQSDPWTNKSNAVFAYPVLPSQGDCPDCCGWLEALGDYPQTTQRKGWMWEGKYEVYAAYCNPSIVQGFNSTTCTTAGFNYMCGPLQYIHAGDFGTTLEFSFDDASSKKDSPDLSTNYGVTLANGTYFPTSPCPAECAGCFPGNTSPTCTTPPCTNCVALTAPIFFNVPIKWSTDGATFGDCEQGTVKKVSSTYQCLEASCEDAYQYPIDDKQVECPFNADRSYYIEYCPDGTRLPDPSYFQTDAKIFP